MEKYKQLELAEIEKLQSDRHTYLTKVFHHLKKGRGCSLALFFDNLDRRVQDIQEQAFLKASAMARDWASLVFICLRPNTFYKSQTLGVFDAIAPTTFTVGQPDLSLVLKKRFAYARRIAEGQPMDQNILRGAPSCNVTLDLPRVAKLLEGCEFAARKRHGIIPTLEAVSNGNLRRLIDFTRTILCSGHLNTKKIFSKIEEGDHYYIPDFEGVKTLIFGNYMQYDPLKSPFVNLFDIRHADPTEHFLRIAALLYLAKIPSEPPGGGYVKLADLLTYLSAFGYSHNAANNDIEILIEKQCIRKGLESDNTITAEDSIRITSLGKYHLYTLANMFQYLDAVIIDTPILNAEISKKIKDHQNIKERTIRTGLFLDYLDQLSSQIRDDDVRRFWEDTSLKAKENLAEIIDE